jgi:4-(2-carboxyphenyl)-2-oxobut-3-enoate aldolase
MPRPTITAADITGIFGLVPTPATPDADRWQCRMSVDLAATEGMIRAIATAGDDTAGRVGMIGTNGTVGEGASLTEVEQVAFVDCIAATLRATGAAGRTLLFAGATTLNTRDTIARARRLLDAGADGLLLGRPMWLALDDAGIAGFYRDVAEALPGTPIVIYDNGHAFKGKISTALYRELARNPAIVATKHIGGPALIDDLRAVGGAMRVLPLDCQWPALAKQFPDVATACWTGTVAEGASALLRLQAAVGARDWDLAERIAARMNWAHAAMFPDGSLDKFMDYNIPIAHARTQGAGVVPMGPPRPPYTHAPESYLEGGRETGRRWRQVCAEFPL